MQKLSPGYIFTKFILFIIFEMIGAGIAFLFLYAAGAGSAPATSRMLAAFIGLAFHSVMTYRTIRSARLDKISPLTYLLGESITAALFLAIACLALSLMSADVLYSGFGTVLFLPMLGFCYLVKNLYLGLALQLAFTILFTALCYYLKRRQDPSLLGRAKNTENT
jgi:hypothetical protein